MLCPALYRQDERLCGQRPQRPGSWSGRWPDARIEVLDSGRRYGERGPMVENAAALRDAGCSLEEAVTWLSAERATNQIFFTVGNLDSSDQGAGRIGKVTGRAANTLGIKPMILFKERRDLLRWGWPGGGSKKLCKRRWSSCWLIWRAECGPRMTTALRWATATIRRRKTPVDADPCCTAGQVPGQRLREVSLMQIGSTIAVHTGPYALGLGVARRRRKKQ